MSTTDNPSDRSYGTASAHDYSHKDILPVAALTLAAIVIALTPSADFFPDVSSYLPIHTSLELCSVVVSAMVVGLGWNLRHTRANSHVVILAATFLCVASLDILHILSYAGMPDLITPSSPEKAINFWLAARVITAAGLIAILALPVESWPARRCTATILAAVPTSAAIGAAGLYFSNDLPRTFVEGEGLTAFKRVTEFLIMGAYLVTAVLLYRRTLRGEGYNAILLASAAWTLGVGESFFALYSSVTDTFNLAGHIYKVIAYLFIYQAVFAEGVRAPYRTLDEERRQLRRLIRVAPDAILLLEPRTFQVVQANPAAARLLGYSEDELVTLTARDIYAPRQPNGDTTLELLKRVIGDLERGELVVSERYLRTKDGAIRHCEVRSIAIRDRRNGMLIRASFIDVTERKRAEADLADSEARISALLNSMLYAIISIDTQQKIVDFNRAASRMFGLDAAQARGRPIDELIPPRFRPGHAAHVRSFAATAGQEMRPMGNPRDVMGLRANGEEFPIEASISRFSVKGETGMTVVIRDITAQRLIERQLQQAQKMEAIGQLTGGMAHDFNNILTVVQANLDFLKTDLPPDSAQQKLVAVCNRAVNRGTDLTRALLAVARRQPLEPQRVETPALLDGTAELLQRVLGAAVRLKLDVAPGAWPIRVDLAQMESALLNLSVNARDAMPKGGTIILGVRNTTLDKAAPDRDLPAGDYVAITVSDTGTGMSPETVAKALDPFFTTKGSKGTGLGLSMVHGFVRQSGGQVVIDSTPGKGTTVSIYLPRHRDEEPAALTRD